METAPISPLFTEFRNSFRKLFLYKVSFFIVFKLCFFQKKYTCLYVVLTLSLFYIRTDSKFILLLLYKEPSLSYMYASLTMLASTANSLRLNKKYMCIYIYIHAFDLWQQGLEGPRTSRAFLSKTQKKKRTFYDRRKVKICVRRETGQRGLSNWGQILGVTKRPFAFASVCVRHAAISLFQRYNEGILPRKFQRNIRVFG